MEIKFNGNDIRGAQRFGDVGIADDGHAHVIKRTFGQWAIHCLKYYNPFGGYRNRIKQQRNQIYQQLIGNRENPAGSNAAPSRTGNRKMLLRELSTLLSTQEGAAENQTRQATGYSPHLNLGQPKGISAQTGVQRWGNPQTAVAMMPDEKFPNSGLSKLSDDKQIQFKTALLQEMRERIENKIATLRPEWGTATKDTEDAARKEATVAFLIMNHASASKNSSETQPLFIQGQFEESRFSVFEQLKAATEDLQLPVPTDFTVDSACQLVEKLEFKNGELTTSGENLQKITFSAASMNLPMQISGTRGVEFQFPKEATREQLNEFFPTAERFVDFMRKSEFLI